MESIAEAHQRFLFELLVASLSNSNINDRAETVCACRKICNFEPPGSTDHDCGIHKYSVDA